MQPLVGWTRTIASSVVRAFPAVSRQPGQPDRPGCSGRLRARTSHYYDVHCGRFTHGWSPIDQLSEPQQRKRQQIRGRWCKVRQLFLRGWLPFFSISFVSLTTASLRDRDRGGGRMGRLSTRAHSKLFATPRLPQKCSVFGAFTFCACACFFLMLRSHSIRFTRAQGIPKYNCVHIHSFVCLFVCLFVS